ncbi:3-phosphoglycerate dehydrogenase [Sinirhodobacter populi]|uniref:3-phosphoglycerate dehydrogenase n=1 Tax=Paenirhodobacter populi TaxID=2306993 RepID=A0A443KI44_9RHOB|nr:D-isomer specific 2-hydroxyacid dehydrogenase family protein [Sinirhodobacter populi]RWR32435.1 3-phosphoglycerate dehydrogenase [Sinirhodobacter populi]
MRPLFIDCSAFMHDRLAEVLPDHAAYLDLHIGDPAPKELPRLAAGREIVLNGHSYFSAADLAALPDLKRIIFLGAGASSYVDMAAAARLGITVETCPGYGDRAVAEHAFALLLAAARQVARMDRDLRHGDWDPLEGIELGGRTVGVLGFGGIGRAFARIAEGFGMKVLVWNRSPVEGHEQRPLAEVLARADAVSLHMALTAETRGFLYAERIAMLRKGAIIVNTARAGLIDESALRTALRTGHLRHVALDVFDAEPLAPDNPWLSEPRATITSHAGYKTPEASRRLIAMGLARACIPGGEAR